MEKLLYFRNAYHNLEKVTYAFNEPESGDSALTVSAIDSFKIVELEENAISVLVSRKVTSVPKGILKLTVTARVKFYLDPEKPFPGDLKQMKTYFNSKAIDILENAETFSMLSLIVSNLTSPYGRVPIVTPPTFLEKTPVEL